MATITTLGPLRHLRAETNEHILHFQKGSLRRSGAGIAYWFLPDSSAIAQLPAEDCYTDLHLKERSRDFQEVHIQATITYRIANPEEAAARINFGIDLRRGGWRDEPLERLAAIWLQRAQVPARQEVESLMLVDVLQGGADRIHRAIDSALRSDPELDAMGLALVGVQIGAVTPKVELEKALGTPARESLQQKADEALFERRALAVENERAIQENELQSEIELATRREELIQRNGDNRLLEVRQESLAYKDQQTAAMERDEIAARSYAEQTKVRSAAEAEAERALSEAKAEGEAHHVAVWKDAPSKILLGLALREFAGSIDKIQHLNVSPSLLGDALTEFLGSAD